MPRLRHASAESGIRLVGQKPATHAVSSELSSCPQLLASGSTLAVAGVFSAGKTRSLTFLLAWLALTTHLKIAVVHKENPAGRAITKLLTAFDLGPDHQRYFVRPVSREEAETNTACTDYDLRASERHHTSLAAM